MLLIYIQRIEIKRGFGFGYSEFGCERKASTFRGEWPKRSSNLSQPLLQLRELWLGHLFIGMEFKINTPALGHCVFILIYIQQKENKGQLDDQIESK